MSTSRVSRLLHKRHKSFMINPRTKAFMAVADQFQLGELITEKPHPLTLGLKENIDKNLSEAIESFKSVDFEMLDVLISKVASIKKLSEEVSETLNGGGRIFLSGCGATGRLSLVIENIWLQTTNEPDRVVAFMAGGDLALIHSIEKFEDYPEYGARQLEELGFSEKDLLIACTEGGETPWVIGSAMKAVDLGGRACFLFCNPAELLTPRLVRCREVFEDERIKKLDFTASSQALTGSTRLQASSILTAAVGCALFKRESQEDIVDYLKNIKELYQKIDSAALIDFIEGEASLYKNGKNLYYSPSQNVAISVLTDTTERSPTFSLAGFNNQQDELISPSWCYLLFENSKNSKEAWQKLLYREPRALEWEEVVEKAGPQRLFGFDFSRNVLKWRAPASGPQFRINLEESQLSLELGLRSLKVDLSSTDLLGAHLILKMILNMHSTLLMGLMGRFESNIMTFVRPSNNKLVDRTVRYAQYLLNQNGVEVGYESLVNDCFNFMDESNESEPVVKRLVKKYS